MKRIFLTMGLVAAGCLTVAAQPIGTGGPLLLPPSQGQRGVSKDPVAQPIAADPSSARTMHYRPGRYDWNDWNGDWNNNNSWNDRDGRYSSGRVWTGDPWNLSPFTPYNPRSSTPPYANWRDRSVYGTSHRGYHRHNYQSLHDGHAHWRSPSPGAQAGGPRVERTMNLINEWYRVYYGRPLQRWEASKWTSDLQRGMSREEILATILSSADWYHRAGSSARSWIRATLASLGELDARALPRWLVQLNNVGGDRRALADQMVARFGVQPAQRVRPSVLARRDNWNNNRVERQQEQRQRQRRRQRHNH